MQEKIKVAMVDDHAMFRKGVIKLLDSDRYKVLFDVGNGEKLMVEIKLHENDLPDIIIMDIEMPVMNGYMTVSWLRENYPSIKILVVSMIDKEEAIVRMLKLGIKGYLSKEMEPEDLHAALQSIFKRNYYYTDFVTNKLIHSIQAEDGDANDNKADNPSNDFWEQLSKRQKEFVKYACTELTYDEIAEKIFVSPKTIDGYRDAVFNKFGVKNRVGLILFALRNGLVSI